MCLMLERRHDISSSDQHRTEAIAHIYFTSLGCIPGVDLQFIIPTCAPAFLPLIKTSEIRKGL